MRLLGAIALVSLILLLAGPTQAFSGNIVSFKILPRRLPCCTSWYAMNLTGTASSAVLTLNGSSDIVFAFYNSLGNASIPAGSVNLTFYVIQNNASYMILISTPSLGLGDLFQTIWLNLTVNPTLGWNQLIFDLPARTLLKGQFLIIDIIRTTAGATQIQIDSMHPAIFTIDPVWSIAASPASAPLPIPVFVGFAGLLPVFLRVRRRAKHS